MVPEEKCSTVIHRLERVDFECSTAELCQILGVTAPTVGEYVKKGLPKVRRGRFHVPTAVQWCLDAVRGDAPDTEEARRRLYVAQEKHKSLETQILDATVMPSDDVRHFSHAMAGEFVASLDGMAPRLGGELAGIDQPEKVEEIIENETRAIRESVAQKLETLERHLTKLSPDRTPAAKAPRGRMGGRKKDPKRSAGAGPVA